MNPVPRTLSRYFIACCIALAFSPIARGEADSKWRISTGNPNSDNLVAICFLTEKPASKWRTSGRWIAQIGMENTECEERLIADLTTRNLFFDYDKNAEAFSPKAYIAGSADVYCPNPRDESSLYSPCRSYFFDTPQRGMENYRVLGAGLSKMLNETGAINILETKIAEQAQAARQADYETYLEEFDKANSISLMAEFELKYAFDDPDGLIDKLAARKQNIQEQEIQEKRHGIPLIASARVEMHSPVCADPSLINDLRKANQSGLSEHIIRARTRIHKSGCAFANEGEEVAIESSIDGLYKVRSISGNFLPGYIDKHAVVREKDVDDEKQRIEAILDSRKRKAEAARAQHDRLISEYTKFVDNELARCESGSITGLIAGEGGIIFSPIEILERASNNDDFRRDSTQHGMRCVVEGARNSYCVGILHVNNESVVLTGHGLAMYSRYGESLTDYVSFFMAGNIGGVEGVFRMYARASDFTCR